MFSDADYRKRSGSLFQRSGPTIPKQQPELPYLGPDDATPDRLVGVSGCLDILAE